MRNANHLTNHSGNKNEPNHKIAQMLNNVKQMKFWSVPNDILNAGNNDMCMVCELEC